jgi:hypothetical protein
MKDLKTTENQENTPVIFNWSSGIPTIEISIENNFQSISGESSTPFDGTKYI